MILMNPIRVVLIEDDIDWLNIMETIIGNEDDIVLVGCGTTKEEAINLSKALDHIDIFLVDINLTDNNLDGIYTALELKSSGDWKVLMLTSMSDEDIIQKSFIAGATDYILKKDVHKIPHIVRSIYHEPSNPVEVILQDYRRMKSEEQLKDLTNAEREVYKLIEQGHSRRDIQKKLMKSDNTLKNQIKNILKKMSVSNSKEAIRKVKSGGLW
jgi:DNA-binding NarL/FixJ family response regulator